MSKSNYEICPRCGRKRLHMITSKRIFRSMFLMCSYHKCDWCGLHLRIRDFTHKIKWLPDLPPDKRNKEKY